MSEPNTQYQLALSANRTLAAEIDRLKAENESLKGEIAYLIKAGNELERILTSKVASYEVGNASKDWLFAKGICIDDF